MKKTYLYIILCLLGLGTNGLRCQTDRFNDSLNAIIQSTNVDTIKLRAMITLGWHYRAANNDKAIGLTRKALDFAIKCKNKRYEGMAYLNLGGVYIFSGNYSQAAENLVKALPIVEALHDSLQIGMAYNNLAIVYTEQLNYPLAISYNEKALEIKKAGGNKKGMASAYQNIGMLYAYQTKYDKAKELFLQSLQLQQETGDAQGIAECYQSLGNIESINKNPDEAITFYNRALAIYDSLNDMENKGGCLSMISEVLSQKKQYKQALNYGLQSLALTEKYNIDREDTYKALVIAYEGNDNAKEALKFQRKLMNLRDSIYNIELSGKTIEIQTKYETEKKEKEILLLEKEKTESETLAETRKLWVIIAIASGLFLTACLLLILLRNYSRKKQNQIEFEKSNLEFEQKALRAQMNPHFLFNAINSIQSYILNKNQQEAYDYLAKFSKLIRIVLNNSHERTLMLHQELEMIKLHVEMEQMRFNNSFEFNLTINTDINQYEMAVPAMLIQPYVENAIWHGLMNLENERKGILNLNVAMNDTLLKIVIQDNGIGRERAKEYKKEDGHRSVGLKLTEQRLLMINKMEEYENARVLIKDVKNEKGEVCGTRVEIFIPALNAK